MELTRAEIETILERRYLGRVITYTPVKGHPVTGKLHSVSADALSGELMVIFVINHTRYECDIDYFFENVKLHGDPSGTNTRDPGLRKGDREVSHEHDPG